MRDERAQLLVQLVATAFADVLMGRLTDEDLPEAAPTPRRTSQPG